MAGYSDILIRPYRKSDSLTEITDLLHRAYKALADQGMRYVASHQSEEVTYDRIIHGTCFIAEMDGRIVGTITLYDGEKSPHYKLIESCSYFGQFAVKPTLQSKGIGSMLLDKV